MTDDLDKLAENIGPSKWLAKSVLEWTCTHCNLRQQAPTDDDSHQFCLKCLRCCERSYFQTAERA